MGKLILILACVVALYLVSEVVRFVMLMQRGSSVSESAKRFEQVIEHATRTFVVMGDSTAVGTGAGNPHESVAGRIGKDFPESTVRNYGINGLKAEGLVQELKKLPEEKVADVLIVQIGGNDILRFTELAKLRKDITEVLHEAALRADTVIVMSTGNVGSAPAFGMLTSKLYEWRTRQVRALFIELTTKKEVSYVDLFIERKDDPFVADPKTYHSPDGLHPSGTGYGLWYEKLHEKLPQSDSVKEDK